MTSLAERLVWTERSQWRRKRHEFEYRWEMLQIVSSVEPPGEGLANTNFGLMQNISSKKTETSMSNIFADLDDKVSFNGGGGGSSGGSSDRQERRNNFHRNRNATAQQRQAEIDAGLRPGLSTMERNQALGYGVTAAVAASPGGPKASAIAGTATAVGTMVVESWD